VAALDRLGALPPLDLVLDRRADEVEAHFAFGQNRGDPIERAGREFGCDPFGPSQFGPGYTPAFFARLIDFGGVILEALVVARHLVPSTQSSTFAGRGRSVTSLVIC
jgi:hypothetical protein